MATKSIPSREKTPRFFRRFGLHPPFFHSGNQHYRVKGLRRHLLP
jgi:hypothetical protein